PRAWLRLGGVVVVAEAVQAPAVDLPDQQAPPRLELADVARGLRVAPAVVADRPVPVLAPPVQRQPVGAAGHLLPLDHLVGAVAGQVAGRLARLDRVTGDATAFEDGPDVAVELDALDLLLVAQAGLAAGVPAAAGLVGLPGGQQRGAVDEVPEGVVL